MAFKCPNCAGNLYYSISKKSLKCESCDSLFPVEDFPVTRPQLSQDTSIPDESKAGEDYPEGKPFGQNYKLGKNETAEEHVFFDGTDGSMPVVSFVCKNCGAELLSPDESMISYCSYCGSEAMLEGRLTDEVRPKYILPFQKTKKECKRIYQERTKGMFFLPKDLKSPEYLERFRGTYIPYWMYNIDFPETATFEATTRKRRGDNVTETTYEVEAKIKGEYEGVPYDASSCFDDTISDMLMPFDKKKLLEFQPGYLAGFYADRADVPASKYHGDAKKRARKNALNEIKHSVKKSDRMDVQKH